MGEEQIILFAVQCWGFEPTDGSATTVLIPSNSRIDGLPRLESSSSKSDLIKPADTITFFAACRVLIVPPALKTSTPKPPCFARYLGLFKQLLML